MSKKYKKWGSFTEENPIVEEVIEGESINVVIDTFSVEENGFVDQTNKKIETLQVEESQKRTVDSLSPTELKFLKRTGKLPK
jgi:hypothetical protein